MRNIAGIMHAEVEDNFSAQGRPGWKPLSENTIAERQRLGYWPGRILQRTGELVTSITAESDANRALVGTNKIYAAILNFGGEIMQAARSSLFTRNRSKGGKFAHGTGIKAKGGAGKITFGQRLIKIPGRAFMMLSPRGIEKILEAVKSFLKV